MDSGQCNLSVPPPRTLVDINLKNMYRPLEHLDTDETVWVQLILIGKMGSGGEGYESSHEERMIGSEVQCLIGLSMSMCAEY